MTVLGKMLVFFILVLTLVWTGLTVNVFVTRTNWMNEANRWKEKAKEAEQSATYQRKLAEEARNVGAARVANLQSELDKLRASNDQLVKEAAAAKDQLAVKLTAQQQQLAPDQLLQANIARLQKQVDILQASLSGMEKQVNEATVASEKAKGDALRAAIDRDAAMKRADDLETRVLSLTEQINTIRRGTGGGSAETAPPEGFRATVTRVDGNLVEISLGANAKLRRGAVLSVYRTQPAKYLGTLTITQVDPQGAVGQFSPPAGVTRPAADDRPRAGDTVGVLNQ